MQIQPYLALGYFNMGGGEIILLLAIVLMLFWNDKLPRIAKWLWGEDARDAGRSFGGIYGKSTFQALTTENKVAELYDPAQRKDPNEPKRRKRLLRWLSELWARVLSRWRWR